MDSNPITPAADAAPPPDPREGLYRLIGQVAAIAGIVALALGGSVPGEVALPAVLLIYGVPVAARAARKKSPAKAVTTAVPQVRP